MHLSRLILNPNSRQVATELRYSYEMHRTLSKAFYNDDNDPGRVLYRVDQYPHLYQNAPIVIVQSIVKPDWSQLTAGDSYLKEDPTVKEIDVSVKNGDVLRFRLRAHPTKRCAQSKRILYLSGVEALKWLRRKGELHGFTPTASGAYEGLLTARNTENPPRHLSMLFEGTLVVADASKFMTTITTGIGRAKAYGFGLLSVAPA